MELNVNVNLNANEAPKEIKVFYRYKKLTKNQSEFIYMLINRLLLKTDLQIYEFPPTLDKDFLYCSVIYSLKVMNFVHNKIIIIANNYEKVSTIINIFAEVKRHYMHGNHNHIDIKIVPFYERKYNCYKIDQLDKASSFDYDNYCIEQNAMWNKDDKQQCPFYRNIILRSNSDSHNNALNMLPSAQYDIEEQLKLISNHELCSYYLYFFNIMKDNYDIIVCHHKDFFDLRERVSLQKLTNYNSNPSRFTLVFDECNNINENIISSYSSVIDETLLNNARIELYLLKEAIKTYGVTHYEMNIDEEKEKETSPSLAAFKPEKEILNYSLIVESGSRKFPGNIRRSEHFLNLISRLLIHFSNELISKEEQVSVYNWQWFILRELWIDFRTLKHLFKRLIYQFNEIEYLNYANMYHLIHFVQFVNHMALFQEGFIMHSGSLQNNEIFLEHILMEPNMILNSFNNNNNMLYLTGGIGNIATFAKIMNKKFMAFYDDNFTLGIKNNIFLTNTSNTSQSNPAFFGEMLKKICTRIPDGIICYFSSMKLLEDYVRSWHDQKVFDFILDYKLIFIEESNSTRLSAIVTNYKKACLLGRGAVLFLSIRNKASLLDELTGAFSKGIIFLGFPIETKRTKILELKTEYYKKVFDINQIDYLNYDTLKLFTYKIVSKIHNSEDKKIIMILEDRLLSREYKKYLPLWLEQLIHNEHEEDSNNVDDRIQMISNFLLSSTKQNEHYNYI